jgi:tetratricopeptide (TPR) repeat protein
MNAIFHKANELYEQGKYDEAIEEYAKLTGGNYESGNIYYNIGNCYFKKGRIGKTILYYERARKLMPRDRDLKANYDYAASQIKGGTERAARLWILRTARSVFRAFSVNGLTFILSFIYIAIIILVIVIFVFGYHRLSLKIALIAMILFFLADSFALYRRISHINREAVVTSEYIDAKFEPFERATTYFTLYEGMKADIIAIKGVWNKVKRPDGKTGWVPVNSIEII